MWCSIATPSPVRHFGNCGGTPHFTIEVDTPLEFGNVPQALKNWFKKFKCDFGPLPPLAHVHFTHYLVRNCTKLPLQRYIEHRNRIRNYWIMEPWDPPYWILGFFFQKSNFFLCFEEYQLISFPENLNILMNEVTLTKHPHLLWARICSWSVAQNSYYALHNEASSETSISKVDVSLSMASS